MQNFKPEHRKYSQRALSILNLQNKRLKKDSCKLNVSVHHVQLSQACYGAPFTLLPGAVERVKIRDYVFVHFTNREDAVEAMKALNVGR